MSTIRANAILDASGGNTATINGKLPAGVSDGVYTNLQVFTASGTFTPPAGVTSVYAIVIGGGGGGSNFGSLGNIGGAGGFAAGVVSVSGSTAVTVGAGGTGSNTTAGTAGGTSSFGTISATGGAAGVVNSNAYASGGVGSGGAYNYPASTGGFFALENVALYHNFLMRGGYIASVHDHLFPDISLYGAWRVAGAGLTAPIAYSASGTLVPGLPGYGETSASGNDAAGGVGGVVFIFW